MQPKNAKSPILVMLLGIVMLDRLVHSENARNPMLVTLWGIVMLDRLGHSENANAPMLVTDFPPIVGGMLSVVGLPVRPVMVFTPSKTNALSGEYPRFARATGSVALVWAIANPAGCTAECKVLLSAPGASALAVATLPVVEKDDIKLYAMFVADAPVVALLATMLAFAALARATGSVALVDEPAGSAPTCDAVMSVR